MEQDPEVRLNQPIGQWTWGKGMTPKEQRTEACGDHRIAAFDSTGEAAYAHAL